MRTPQSFGAKEPLPHSSHLLRTSSHLQSPTAADALRLTGTLVSQYFRFGCDRQLRWQMVPRALRGADVPAPNRDPSAGPLVGVRPGMGLLTQAGRRFERQALRALVRYYGESRVVSAGHDEHGDAARLPYDAVVRALRDPGEATWIVQPELRLPDPAAFAARFGDRSARCRWRPRSRTSSASAATGGGG